MKKKFVKVTTIEKTIVRSEGIEKKGLATFKLDSAMLCEFGCTYCYATLITPLRRYSEELADLTEEQIGERIYPENDPGLTFEYPDIIENLEKQLSKMKKSWGRGHTLVFSMLTDGFSPNLVKTGVTEEALTIVLERTSFRIRVLTKNRIVGKKKWIEFFQKYPKRFVVGLSIGSLDNKWAKKVEINVPPPSERLKAYENLQAAGIPTFGMLCPVFPDVLENNSLEELIDKVNPSAVEEFWAEPYNDRKNWAKVREGYDRDSETYKWFTNVFGQKDWELLSKYQVDLYTRIRRKATREGWLHKLKFLLYEKDITPEDALRMEGLDGVLLQSPKDDKGFSKNTSIASLERIEQKWAKRVENARHGHMDIRTIGHGIDIDENELSEELLPALKTILDDTAIKTLIEADANLDEQDLEQIVTRPIFEIKNEKFVGEPIRILASISKISDPIPIEVEEGARRITTFSIVLRDRSGNEIGCVPLLHNQFESKAHRYFQTKGFFIFQGTVLSVIHGRSSEYKFYIKNIEEIVNATDLLYLKPELKDRIGKIYLRTIKKEGGLLGHIKSKLIRELGIKGLKQAKELDKCVDFAILQSFSQGMDKTNSMKLHSLVIGPPGVGKKLLTKIAMILNPSGIEVSSTQGKLTDAGLIGNVMKKDGMTISEPGYLSQASGGVFCIQDFHELAKGKSSIMATLAKVMEDGEVIDSTSARTTHAAVTSIHLDMNRMSQVDKSMKFNPFEDLKIPINVLSRFDFIMDIPPDKDRQKKVAFDIIKGKEKLSAQLGTGSESQWERELKVMIAYTRATWREVDIPKDIQKYIRKKVKEALGSGDDFQDHIIRVTYSIFKYVKTLACANLRLKAKKEDVDKAFEFIDEKLAFLQEFKNKLDESVEVGSVSTPMARQTAIAKEFKDKEFRKKEVLDHVNELAELPVSDKTITRDLIELTKKGIVKQVGHGKWMIV